MQTHYAGALVDNYASTASKTRDAMAALSPLVSEALALLEQASHPLYGPMNAFNTVATELTTDGRDLAWRVDWIKTTDAQPLGTTGRVSGFVPANLDAAFAQTGLTVENIAAAKALMAQGMSFTDAVKAAQAIDHPDWSQPDQLSDAALIYGIQNWPGTDNDPLLDGLIREFNNRAEPEGGWISLGQHSIVTEEFAAQAYGISNILDPGDRIGFELVAELTAAGFDDETAQGIAANLRVQFPGDEVALQLGLAAALEQLGDDASQPWNGGVNADTFSDVLDTAGESAVLDFNRDFYIVAREAIGTTANQAGHALTNDAIAQIISFAIRNGVTVAAAARQFYGVDLDEPPAGFDKQDVLAPELLEVDVRITQEEATANALGVLADTDYTDEVFSALGTQLMSDFNGDGHPDYTYNPDGQVVVSGYGTSPDTELSQILDIVSKVPIFATDAAFDEQVSIVEHLKDVELGLSLAANGGELNFLDDDQRAILDTLHEHEYVQHILAHYRHPPHPYLDAWPPWTIESIAQFLEVHESPGGYPLLDEPLNPEVISALQGLLEDEELLELLANRGSDDLWEDINDPTRLDFTRVENGADRHALAQILGPYADQIDTARRGDIDSTRVPEDLDAFIEWAEDPVNLVPRRVIEAAAAARAAGFTDTNFMNQLHLGLDLIGATEIPIVSQLADATNAGLYVVVDRDFVNAGISAVGLVGTGAIVLRNGTRVAGRVADFGDGVVSLARSGDVGVDLTTVNAGVNLTANTRRVVVPFGRSGRRTLHLPGDFEVGGVVDVAFNVRRSSGYRRLTQRIDRAAYEVEYVRQLDRQQEALNGMTAERYIEARTQFLQNGRNPEAVAAQRQFRTNWVSEQSDDLFQAQVAARESAGEVLSKADRDAIRTAAEQQARDEASALAALHEPDMVAGGYLHPEPQDMGLANVNSSIGSSWRTRVNSMDAAAQLLVDAGRGSDNLNVNLVPAGS